MSQKTKKIRAKGRAANGRAVPRVPHLAAAYVVDVTDVKAVGVVVPRVILRARGEVGTIFFAARAHGKCLVDEVRPRVDGAVHHAVFFVAGVPAVTLELR